MRLLWGDRLGPERRKNLSGMRGEYCSGEGKLQEERKETTAATTKGRCRVWWEPALTTSRPEIRWLLETEGPRSWRNWTNFNRFDKEASAYPPPAPLGHSLPLSTNDLQQTPLSAQLSSAQSWLPLPWGHQPKGFKVVSHSAVFSS